jgi:NAD(P)H-hydrate epimerase
MKNLPDNLYSVDSVVQLEQIAINQYDIPAYELMKRAGEAVFNVVKTKYSRCKKILVLCGAGNNAGDGYVVARLAEKEGFDVRVISLIDPNALKNEALLAYKDWLSVSENDSTGESDFNLSVIDEADIIIDALLGTGLARDVSAQWAEWITAVNQSSKPVISIDIPSGLLADTGMIAGVAINADTTICFIGLKQGMFTAQAKDVCGEILFDNLALPDAVYTHVVSDAQLIKGINYRLLPKRKASSHKGCFGHVLVVGGNKGMPGAVILAAKAALRSGAGLLTIITAPQNSEAISSAVPEAMIKTCDLHSVDSLFKESFINNISHVAIGMGLAQDDWALQLLQQCVQLNKPMLIDADALNLIAKYDITIKSSLVITPHPGEAARLLSKDTAFSSADIQRDRFSSIKSLRNLFNQRQPCVVVLKGSGTLIFDGLTMKVCNSGNAAMAAPGMGDVLSGIVIALMAQNIEVSDAVELAVCLHASAADLVTGDKTRGLLASDVINALPKVLQ